MKRNALSMHSSVAGRTNLRTYIAAAKAAGFDCIEPTFVQLNYFLNSAHTAADVRALLGDLEVSAVGWLADCERQGYAFVEMMKEAESLFETVSSIGGQAVEIINGPVDYRAVECFRSGEPYTGYMGLQGLPYDEQEALTAKNLRALADLAAQFGLTLYFEPLCWTPIPSLREGIPLIQKVDRDNMKLVVDFYHNYICGVDAEFLARIDKEMILGVHTCNSREPDDRVPCEPIFRDIGFHEGNVPMKEWVDAIKSTGFDNWWVYETFSRHEQEEEVYSFAKYVHDELAKLVNT